MAAPESVRIALLGAGVFAHEAHVPALNALGDAVRIAAVYSRTLESAQQLASTIAYPVDVSDDIDAVLSRDDIDAVDLVLPIHIMPDVIRKALAAGKHVISEKPAAPDLATGQDLLAAYAPHAESLVWMVAENWRYEPVMFQTAEIIQSGEIGTPLLVQFDQHIALTPDNKYYQTAWRREGAYPGGFVLDGGVHHVALLRMILGEIAAVQAATRQMRADLPPLDTINATLDFAAGFTGVYSVTYAAGSPWTQTLHIVGDKGSVLMDRDALRVSSDRGERTHALPAYQGVEQELAAFVAAIRSDVPHRNTPQEALQDVAVIEAMLASGTSGARVQVVRVV